MASKVFKLDISRIGRRARNKRLRESGQGGVISGSSVGAQQDGVGVVQGDGHTHANLAVLNKLGADDNSYIYLEQQRPTAGGNGTQTVNEKAKAGWADDAGKWAGHEFGDWMDQPVRREDDVEFHGVETEGLEVTVSATFGGEETHEGEETHKGVESHEGEETHTGVETHTNTESHHGVETHTGAETHTSTETHNGTEVHYGSETHHGLETHTNAETHDGDEEHNGNVDVTQKLSINENAIAQILGALFLGRSTDFVSGFNGSGGKISSKLGEWNAELDSIFVRKLATVVRGIFSELVSANPTDKASAFFLQGFNGHGARVWFDEVSGWNMELDTLTVRRIMYIFELVIQRIRSVGGILLVSAGCGRVKSVRKVLVRRSVDAGSGGTAAYGEEYESYYKITFEDTNTFVRHDLMRCQRWNNGRYDGVTADDDALLPDQRAMQYYWVEVAYPDTSAFTNSDNAQTPTIYKADDDWNLITDEEEETPTAVVESFSTAYDILVPRSEFITGRNWLVDDNGNYIDDEGNIVDESERIEVLQESIPQEGDECVLMGNTQYTKRQNYIYISATEDGVPRIDVMDSCNSKGGGGDLRCRVGCLDGIVDDFWRGLEQPNGYGLYSDNAWLKGKFIVKVAGVEQDLGTLFEVLDGTIRSTISALREDLIGDEGYISNNVFADGWDKWFIYAEGELYTSDGFFMDDGVSLLSDLGTENYARLITADEDTSGEGRSYMVLKGSISDVRGITQRHADMRNFPTFEQDETKTIAISFYARAVNNCVAHVKLGTSNAAISVQAGTKWKKYVTVLEWDGNGDFTVYTEGGELWLYGFVVSQDVNEALIDKFTTAITETAEQIQLYAGAFTWNEELGKYEVAGFSELKQDFQTLSLNVTNYQNATNASITLLSNSLKSYISQTTEVSIEESNRYVRDAFFAEGFNKFSVYDSQNGEAGSNTYFVYWEDEGDKKRVNMLIFDGYARGIVPQLNWANCPNEPSFGVFVKMSVWAQTACEILVYRKDGNEPMVLVHQRQLAKTSNYVLLQFATTSTRSSVFYFCCRGVNSQMGQIYINGISITDDEFSQAVVTLNSSITQTQGSINAAVGRVETLEDTVEEHTARIDMFSDNISLAVERGISTELGNVFLTPNSPFSGGYRASFVHTAQGKVVSDYVTDDVANSALVVDDSYLGSNGEGIKVRFVFNSNASDFSGKTVIVVFKLKQEGQGDIDFYRQSSQVPLYHHNASDNVWAEQTVEISNFNPSEQLYFIVDGCKMTLAKISSKQNVSSIISSSLSEFNVRVGAIEGKVTTLESKDGILEQRMTTMQQTESSFTFKVDSLMNAIFKNVYPPFDRTVTSSDPDMTEEDLNNVVKKMSDANGDFLRIDDSENNGLLVSFGLADWAEKYDSENIKVRIRGRSHNPARLRLYFNIGSNDYIDIDQSFSDQESVEKVVENEFTVNFVTDYGIKIYVENGVFDLFGIYGKPDSVTSPVSVLQLTQDYFLEYVSGTYVTSQVLANTLRDYATNTAVTNAVSGVFTTPQFSALFSGYIEEDEHGQHFSIASYIGAFVSYKTDEHGNVIRDANNKAELEGGVLIKADAIRLEGYTTINGNFKVDEEGNAEMNNCTIAGVLNNLIQRKVFTSEEEAWYLNPLRWGSIIEYTPISSHALYLPSLYSDENGVHIDCSFDPNHGNHAVFPGMTSEDLRQCIGKKFYLFPVISNNLQMSLHIMSRFLVSVSNRDISFGDPADEVGNNETIAVTPLYKRIIDTYVPTSVITVLQCCYGVYNGKECIYWEVESSASRSDTTIYVYGRLVDLSNRGMADVDIKFIKVGTNDQEQVKTDELGYYACKVTAETSYEVKAYDGSDLTIEGEAGQNLQAFAVGSNSVGLNLRCINN